MRTFLLIVAVLVCLPLNLAGQSASSNLPRYGDLFPVGTVDRYGLTTIQDYGAVEEVYAKALALSSSGKASEAIALLEKHIEQSPKDLKAYVVLIGISDRASKLGAVADSLRPKVRFEVSRNEHGPALSLAYAYCWIIKNGRTEPRQRVEQQDYPQSYIRKLVPRTRLEAMVLISILWWEGEKGLARTVSGDFLKRDPGFYQLRTFYAHMWAYGSEPARNGDGTIDYSTQLDGDGKEVMRQAEMVMKSHPSYAPAYFVASTSPDMEVVKKNMQFFVKHCHPESDWYRRASNFLKRKGP